ncbi:hypothetical protein QUB63_17440 [Microcoleus sp. ARI1-B5]
MLLEKVSSLATSGTFGKCCDTTNVAAMAKVKIYCDVPLSAIE